MTARRTPQAYNSQGQIVALGKELARGGEGCVYEVSNNSDLVAKLYHNPVTKEKANKLRTMVGIRSEQLSKMTAWPSDTVYDRQGGNLLGFLMPKISGYKDIHWLYGVKSRLAEYPDACWPFLIHAATNVARAFAVVHQNGHVIGDVNHGGIVVSQDATVKLVDCDSFQITAQGNRYLCEVGIADFTPPELQGQILRNIIRTPNHDAFGLAVIIFQLLFMGRHPFAGGFLGAKETPPLDKLIQEHRFAYGPGAKSRQMRQPPGTLPLEAVSQPIADLFERAFSRANIRPSAGDWLAALKVLSKSLKQCHINSGHYFYNTLLSCPWCKIETVSGVALFNIVITGTRTAQRTFNITNIWASISAISPPSPLPSLPSISTINVVPSPLFAQKSKKVRIWSYLSTGLIISATIAVIASNFSGGFAFLLIAIVSLVSIVFTRSRIRPTGNADVEMRARLAESQWQEIEQRWRNLGDNSRFDTKLRELETKKYEYQGLDAARRRKLAQLEANQRERQKEKYLDRFRIDRAAISGIGPGRTATLRSYGIETAADISRSAILAVPGFGATYTAKLLAWRHSIEQLFVYNPNQRIDPSDLAALEREFTAARLKLEQELSSGPIQLRQLSQQIKAARESMKPMIEEKLKTLAQARADAQSLSANRVSFAPPWLALLAALAVLSVKYAGVNKSRSDYNTLTNNTAIPTPESTKPANINALSPLSVEEQAKASYTRGVSLTKAGRYEEAVKAYQQAISLNPDLPIAYHELGYALYRLKKYEDAIEAFNKAKSLAPNNAETYRTLGLCYSALSQWDNAVKAFEQAIKIQPNNATTQYNLGQALKKSGEINSAINAYQEAIRIKPDYAQAHYELGLTFLDLGDQDSAINEYTTLTSLNQKLAGQLYEKINQ